MVTSARKNIDSTRLLLKLGTKHLRNCVPVIFEVIEDIFQALTLYVAERETQFRLNVAKGGKAMTIRTEI